MSTNTSPVIGKVCKHVSYSISRFNKNSDLTCAKITNIHADGTRTNQLAAINNYKQPFWIVKPNLRKFKQHKDYIEENQVREYWAPRCQIPMKVKEQLYGVIDRSATIRDVSDSPYVFGLDQTPAVHLKQRFFEKYGEFQEKEPYTVAAFDVEGDMFVKGTPIMMASVTFKTKAFFVGVRSWYKEKDDATILRKLKEAEHKYISEHLKRRNCTVEYLLVDTPGQVAYECIQKFHEWQTDWVASWNAGFDMGKCEEALQAENYDLADVYCDKSIPKEFRTYKLDYGRTHKVKENGDKTPLEPQEKWPTVRNLAMWQWLDAMSAYGIKRAPAGKLDSYGLEATAERVKVPGKLYTEEGADKIPGSPQWHRYMQKEHPYLYSMYNIVDNFVIEEINEATNDLSLTIPMLLRFSEYHKFTSQPKLISDTLSFIGRKFGYVWGSTPSIRDKAITNRLPGLGDWIALLDTEKNSQKGRAIFAGLFDVFSTGRSDTSDLDVAGAYPHATVALNVSNKTCMAEVFGIQGADETKFREIAVSYASSPQANAVMLAHALFQFPQYAEMVNVFEKLLEDKGEHELLNQLRKSRNDSIIKEKEAA